jgi:uncharacterized RDD family membrane protein YckC
VSVGEASHAAAAARAQAAAAERAHGVEAATPGAPYAGLVTRALAFAIDAAVVDGVGALVGIVIGLSLSILDLPDTVRDILIVFGGFAFVVWTFAYFVAFWSGTGQTPGMRVMRIRVRRAAADEPLRVRWAIVRLVGLFLAALPLLLGFVPILLNDRRRGLQDLLGRSVVVHEPGQVKSSATS